MSVYSYRPLCVRLDAVLELYAGVRERRSAVVGSFSLLVSMVEGDDGSGSVWSSVNKLAGSFCWDRPSLLSCLAGCDCGGRNGEQVESGDRCTLVLAVRGESIPKATWWQRADAIRDEPDDCVPTPPSETLQRRVGVVGELAQRHAAGTLPEEAVNLRSDTRPEDCPRRR